MQTLTVALDARSYPIHIGAGILGRAGTIPPLAGAPRAIIVTNPVVAAHHLATCTDSLTRAGTRFEVIVVPDGEANKSWSTLYDIHTRLIEFAAERSTVLVALGGGVVGDLTGFAAATYQRGVALVQIPTTLLAQVDSSVGGKTAVNHPLGKNMIGAFHQPAAVIIDTATLSTLPDREYCAGIAEVIKYGAALDREFFAWLESNIDALLARDPAAVEHAVLESCRIKAEVVAADEREAGGRALLNFGHTFGHAIEAATGYGAWLHGEAIAAGMVLASGLSRRVSALDAGDDARLTRLIAAARLPTMPPAIAFDQWMTLMARDKKSEAGRTRFVLLDALGRASVKSGIEQADLRALLAA